MADPTEIAETVSDDEARQLEAEQIEATENGPKDDDPAEEVSQDKEPIE